MHKQWTKPTITTMSVSATSDNELSNAHNSFNHHDNDNKGDNNCYPNTDNNYCGES